MTLPSDLMRKLTHSMSRRLRLCMENKGPMTKYLLFLKNVLNSMNVIIVFTITAI